jgi:hypothetical protein
VKRVLKQGCARMCTVSLPLLLRVAHHHPWQQVSSFIRPRCCPLQVPPPNPQRGRLATRGACCSPEQQQRCCSRGWWAARGVAELACVAQMHIQKRHSIPRPEVQAVRNMGMAMDEGAQCGAVFDASQLQCHAFGNALLCLQQVVPALVAVFMRLCRVPS